MPKLTKKQRQALQGVGRWATAWWLVTGVYVLLVVWLAKDKYVAAANTDKGWSWAISQVYAENALAYSLLALVLVGWIGIAICWMRTLRSAKISFGDGLRDLLFTLR